MMFKRQRVIFWIVICVLLSSCSFLGNPSSSPLSTLPNTLTPYPSSTLFTTNVPIKSQMPGHSSTPAPSKTPNHWQSTPSVIPSQSSSPTPTVSIKPNGITPTPSPTPTFKGTTPSPNDPNNIFAAPKSAVVGNGSFAKPYVGLNNALNLMKPGQTLYLRGGTYDVGFQGENGPAIKVNAISGTADSPIRVFAYPGEKPCINFDKVVNDGYTTIGANFTDISYWQFKNIEFKGMRSTRKVSYINGLNFQGDHNTLENLNIHHMGGPGVNMGGYGTDYNLILNCDFHHNFDEYGGAGYGGNGDGFALKGVPGNCNHNIVRGCRFYYNSDDGFDSFVSEGIINIENCWSFLNGFVPDTFDIAGDGNGFKLGKSDGTWGKRILKDCMAFQNGMHGVTQNGLKSPAILDHCTMAQNGINGNWGRGFDLIDSSGAIILYNCLDYGNKSSYCIASNATLVGNSWQAGGSIKDSDFVSTDYKQALRPRKADGSLPDMDYLRPKPSASIANRGSLHPPEDCTVRSGYAGSAPAIGAVEE